MGLDYKNDILKPTIAMGMLLASYAMFKYVGLGDVFAVLTTLWMVTGWFQKKDAVLAGVVTPRDDLFDEWVKIHGKQGEQYVQVSREEDLGGFDRIEPGLCWEVLGDLYFKARKC